MFEQKWHKIGKRWAAGTRKSIWQDIHGNSNLALGICGLSVCRLKTDPSLLCAKDVGTVLSQYGQCSQQALFPTCKSLNVVHLIMLQHVRKRQALSPIGQLTVAHILHVDVWTKSHIWVLEVICGFIHCSILVPYSTLWPLQWFCCLISCTHYPWYSNRVLVTSPWLLVSPFLVISRHNL